MRLRVLTLVVGVAVASCSPSTSLGERDTSSQTQTSSAPFPYDFGVIGFRLANADTDELLGPVVDGDVIDRADYGGAQLSLAAETAPQEVGSVQFFTDGQPGLIEDFLPYTLGGNIELDLLPWTLSSGVHTVRAEPYALASGEGALGTTAAVTFELR